MDAEVTEPIPTVKPDRTLLAILIVVGLLIVVAVVVVLARSGARELLDPSTPEGVVQRYAQAVIDGDDATAAGYITERAQQCELYSGYESGDAQLRLTLQSTDISGSNATVRVSVTTSYDGSYGGDPFSNSEYSYDAEFTLVSSGGSWLIKETPYEFLPCDASYNK